MKMQSSSEESESFLFLEIHNVDCIQGRTMH